MLRSEPCRSRAGLLALAAVLVVAYAGPSAAGTFYLGVSDFFRPWAIMDVKLNPTGQLYVARFTPDSTSTIRVAETHGSRTAEVRQLFDEEISRITLLEWVGSQTLVAVSADKSVNHVVRVDSSTEEMHVGLDEIEVPGTLVCPLVEDEERIVWSPHADPSSAYRVTLDQITVSPRDGSSPFPQSARVAHLDGVVVYWICGPAGVPRFALLEDVAGRLSARFRPRGTDDWRAVDLRDESKYEWMNPLGISEDGRKLLVAARAPTGRWALYRYKPGKASSLTLVLEHSERDLYGIFPGDGYSRVQAAFHFERGEPRFSFLDSEDRLRWENMRRRFPGFDVWPVSRSADGRVWVVWVGSPSDAGRLFTVTEGGTETELGRIAPQLPQERMARLQPIELEVSGVGKIEAYLSLPTIGGDHPPPLVVYPHGGPIGVMDVAVFDPAVQLLTAAGYAVLQVNYRGSAGFGEAFERAGWREWGRGIEDDVDAAVDAVQATGAVDGERMCIMGESYGGYSALMSVVRHPKRYRCAISTAGVTDIGLLFNSSDFTVSEAGREEFSRVVGDPETDYEEMKAYSPVYRVEEIETPILLVHGADDTRVDVEHALRLDAMLEVYGKVHRTEIRRGLGHSEWSFGAQRAHYEMVLEFLREYL